MTRHVQQPTQTSCGPAAVAMLVGRPVAEVLEVAKAARLSRSRRRRRDDRMNIGEAERTLAFYGFVLFRRQRGLPNCPNALIREDHETGSGWHWFACVDGEWLDPARPGAVGLHFERLSFYPVRPRR